MLERPQLVRGVVVGSLPSASRRTPALSPNGEKVAPLAIRAFEQVLASFAAEHSAPRTQFQSEEIRFSIQDFVCRYGQTSK